MPPKRKKETAGLDSLSLVERKHTRFDDDDNDSQAAVDLRGPNEAGAHDQEDAGPCLALHPRTQATVGAAPAAYVLDLAANATCDRLAVGSDQGLFAYQIGPSNLTPHGLSPRMDGQITAVGFTPEASTSFHACSATGDVVCWDFRQKHECQRYTAGRYLNCLDQSENLLAVGTNGSILFWDRRKAANSAMQHSECLAEFSDTHEAEVTQVRFHPEGKLFFSGSTDGLLSVFDINNQLDEDDGFAGALNLMDSIAELDFYGPKKEQLWCRTHTDNLYLWDWKAGCSEEQEGGEGPIASLLDAREQFTSLMPHSKKDPYTYLVGCRQVTSAQQLQVVAGTSHGNFAAFPIAIEGKQCILQGQCLSMHKGHSSVIRKALWLGENAPFTCISGAEDGKVLGWTAGQ